MKKIAVITPYYNEDLDLIKKANESVLNQNNKEFECEHIIIVDGYDNNNYLKNLDCFSLDNPLELASEDLRLAARALGQIVGTIDVEQILDEIFLKFCIGK